MIAVVGGFLAGTAFCQGTDSALPVITGQPVSQTVTAGSPVTFGVTAFSGTSLSYAWSPPSPRGEDGLFGPGVGGSAPDGTSSTYVISSADPSDIGEYSVIVTNASGSVRSQTVLLTVIPATAPQALYELTDLGSLGEGSSAAFGLNAAGLVVGSSETAYANKYDGAPSGATHAFLYSGGAMQDLNPPGYASELSAAYAINDAGEAVGAVSVGPSPDYPFFFHYAACTFEGGNLNILPGIDFLASSWSTACGVNDSGQIAITEFHFEFGLPFMTNGQFVGPGALPIVEGNPPSLLLDTPTSATGINDAGQGVGTYLTHAYIFTSGESQDLGTLDGTPGFSSAAAINASGDVAGQSETASGATHAFLYAGGTMQDLGVPAGWTGSSALALNASDEVVGSGTDANGFTRAFVFTPSAGINDLNNLVALSDGNTPGFIMLNWANAVNDSGEIAGTGIYFDGNFQYFRAFLLKPLFPPILTSPSSQAVATGSTVVFTVVAPGASSYQWQFDGVNLADGTEGTTNIAGSQGSQLVLTGAAAASAGSYTCSVTYTRTTGSPATITTSPAILTVAADMSAGSLINMSARGFVGTGNGNLIGGFYISGSTSRTFLIQALGPALAAEGVSGALQHPALTIHDSTGATIYSNSGWGSSPVLLNAAAAAYAQPVLQLNSADSEILLTLPPGGYTAEISGADGGTGVALCAIYELL
jgi:probable HAF family extracellular repeat protein